MPGNGGYRGKEEFPVTGSVIFTPCPQEGNVYSQPGESRCVCAVTLPDGSDLCLHTLMELSGSFFLPISTPRRFKGSCPSLKASLITNLSVHNIP